MNLHKWLLVTGIPIIVNVCFAQYKTLHFPFDQSSILSLFLILINLVLFYFLSKYLRNPESKNSFFPIEYLYAGLLINIGILFDNMSLVFAFITLVIINLRMISLKLGKV
ncbi:hypothetical protein [Flectobacillus rivi]|uniref:EamA domain-containing protein n=1 Tax=Flectobacillus rivi TaxID=2984209 RepID=A0ABT6Z4S5_9BACT|nr:hypothetical protein [Flectobacillus rivi]MDI9876120.1 hypothetical protein [Flectobacillus rivi]